ncbi:MAG: hypothetical protein GKR93_12595 [Gammaproteobacteria bacterium]|nr:hypothetical protein [Gammaproteobacteria bacterium]
MNMLPISPKETRYIKLGAGGTWARWAIEHNEIPFGYRLVPHQLCLSSDWEAVRQYLIDSGERKPNKATDGLREVRDFYTLGEKCLWVTIADDQLWWAFAHSEVTWISDDPHTPNRTRKTIGKWRNVNIHGEPLNVQTLSSRLTQVSAFRGTICRIRASDHLIRCINAKEEPVVMQVQQAKNAMVKAAVSMIHGLHWADFEVMVDLIFARTGWQRISRLGGSMKDIDLSLIHPTIGETAFVQVKSKANQAVLDEYIERFKSSNTHDRMFFVCHSLNGEVNSQHSSNKKINIWTGIQLAEAALKAGLYDWLIEKSL